MRRLMQSTAIEMAGTPFFILIVHKCFVYVRALQSRATLDDQEILDTIRLYC